VFQRSIAALLALCSACILISDLGFAAGAPSAAALLAEVRRTFTVEGKPIPPEIFRDMGDGDMADSTSILVTVDVKAAVGSNLYDDEIRRYGDWVLQRKENQPSLNGYEETGYRFIGTTANGLLVVVASYNGGGSGTFHTLHILDAAKAKAFDAEGEVYDRVNLTMIRSVVLGDRWDGEVTIAGNTVTSKAKRQDPTDGSGETSTLRLQARRP
jgi:hypothetical protein